MNALTSTILVVDDNDDDVYALKRALKKANIANPLQVVIHGQEAMDYLSGEGKYSDRSQFPLPFIIFVDLKTPFRNGLEVLAWIREQPALRQVMVVVLTGSDEVRDHQRASSLGARSYLVKPLTPSDLQQLMQSRENDWISSSDRIPVVNTQ